MEKRFNLDGILNEFGKQNCFIIDSNYNVAGMNEADDMFENLYNNNTEFVKLVQSLIEKSDIWFDSSSEKSALMFALDKLNVLDYFNNVEHDEYNNYAVEIVETVKEAFETDFVKNVNETANKYGYDLDYCWKQSSYDNLLRFRCYPKNYNEKNGYTPKIYMEENEEHEIVFSMQTTSYGSLDGANLDKFMKEIKDGYDFVKYLNDVDWDDCPIMNR